MRYKEWMLLLVFLAVGMIGCTGSDTDEATPSDAQPGASDQSASVPTEAPAVAVFEFLEAIRSGDDAKAAEMFTPLARQRVAQLGYNVAPEGTDTASFAVGRVHYLAEGGARVAATWTDLDETGQPRTDEMVWMVRRCLEGWRVAGMATTVFEGEPPLLLDFENPEETVRKLQMLRDELLRQAELEQIETQQAENSADSIRR